MDWLGRCIPTRSTGTKPYSNTVICLAVPFLPHLQSTEKRRLAVLDEAWMHSPGVVFRVLPDIHDNLSQTATDAAFLDCTAESVKAVSISELSTDIFFS